MADSIRAFLKPGQEAIKELILELEQYYSPEEIAHRIGIKRPNLNKYKNGKHSERASKKYLALLAERFKDEFEVEDGKLVIPLAKSTDPDSLFYVYYYWIGSKIAKGVTKISIANSQWVKLELQFVNKEGDLQKTIIADPLNDNEYSQTKTIFFATNNIPDKAIYSFLVDSKPILLRNIVFGCYLKSATKGFKPVAGVCLMIKQDSEASAMTEAKAGKIDAFITNTLYNRRIELYNEDTVYRAYNTDFPFYKELEKLKDFAGTYLGFHLDNNYKNGSIRTVILELKDDGFATIFDENNSHNGFFSINSQGLLYGTFDREEKEEINRLHLWFECELRDEKYLHGIYSGWGSDSNKQPMTGLVIFQRYEQIHRLELGDKPRINFEGIKFPSSYDRNDQRTDKELQDFFKVNRKMLLFFKSDIDSYINKPARTIDQSLLDLVSNEKNTEEYSGPAGLYHIYSYSSQKGSIVQYPIKIDQNGVVTMKGLLNRKATEYIGRAKYDEDYLILDFLPFKKGTRGIYLLFVGNRTAFPDLTIASGISIRINLEGKPQAKREIMVTKLFGDNSKSKPNAQLNKVFKGLRFNDIFPASKKFSLLAKAPIDSSGRQGSLSKSLFGREYNLIVTAPKTNESKLLNRENFRKLYLVNASYNYTDEFKEIKRLYKKNSDDILQLHKDLEGTLCYRYFVLAMEHGLVNLDEEEFLRKLRIIRSKIHDLNGCEKYFKEWYTYHRQLMISKSKKKQSTEQSGLPKIKKKV